MSTLTFGCASTYAFAAGRRAASTQTVISPETSAGADDDSEGEASDEEDSEAEAEAVEDELGSADVSSPESDPQAASTRAEAVTAMVVRTSLGHLAAAERRTVIMVSRSFFLS